MNTLTDQDKTITDLDLQILWCVQEKIAKARPYWFERTAGNQSARCRNGRMAGALWQAITDADRGAARTAHCADMQRVQSMARLSRADWGPGAACEYLEIDS